jgi:hypothetical protein
VTVITVLSLLLRVKSRPTVPSLAGRKHRGGWCLWLTPHHSVSRTQRPDRNLKTIGRTYEGVEYH